VADAYVSDWTLYSILARAKVQTDELGPPLARMRPDSLKALPRMPARTFPACEGAMARGWLTQLAMAKDVTRELPYFRIAGVASMCKLVALLGTSDGWRALSDVFCTLASDPATPVEVVARLVTAAPPLPKMLKAFLTHYPRVHVLYGAVAVQRLLATQIKSYGLRGATFLVTAYKLRVQDGPSLNKLAVDADHRLAFLTQCRHDACLLPATGVLLRTHPCDSVLPDVRLHATRFADVVAGRELVLAMEDAKQYPEGVRAIVNVDPAALTDIEDLEGAQYTNTYIIGGHFLSLVQLKALIRRLPGPVGKKITLYGCPALAPLADAAVPKACNVISAVRELTGRPTGELEDLRRPMALELAQLLSGMLPPSGARPYAEGATIVRSPSQLYSLLYRRAPADGPLAIAIMGVDWLPLDELLCYAYLLHRFRAAAGARDSVRAAFDKIAETRPLSLEYWTRADFASALR